MTVEQGLRLMSGSVTLVGTALTLFHSPWWGLFLVFVALNNIQSAFTDTCPAVWFLQRAGLKRCGEKVSADGPAARLAR